MAGWCHHGHPHDPAVHRLDGRQDHHVRGECRVLDSYSASINIMKKAKSYEKSIVLTTELGHMNTISYLPNPRYKKYKTDKIYYEAILSWENTLSWFINYLKNI